MLIQGAGRSIRNPFLNTVSPSVRTRNACLQVWIIAVLCPQGVGATGTSDAGRLRHQLGGRTVARVHVRRAQNQRPSVLQVYAAGRPVRRGRAQAGQTGAVHAAHSAHLFARQRRRLFGSLRMGRRMGSSASR